VLAAQVALSRRAISSGSLDGVMGAQTAPRYGLSSNRKICRPPARSTSHPGEA